MFAAQHNIPADFLDQGKEFAGCGSEIELFTCDTQAVCKHCGFVVNLGGATCADVLALCDEVRAIVKEKTGYDLEKEIRVVEA